MADLNLTASDVVSVQLNNVGHGVTAGDSVAVTLVETGVTPEITAKTASDVVAVAALDVSVGANEAGLFWPPASEQDWVPWPGRVEGATRQVYEFRIITAPGAIQGVIEALRLIFDVDDVFEHFEDVAISSSGNTRLTLTRTFRVIKTVQVTVQTDGGTAVLARVKDKGSGGPPLTLGPNIETLNAASANVNGTVDADVTGY